MKIKDENGKIILTAPKKAPSEEMESFSLELSNAIENFNSQLSGLKPGAIKKGSFYTGAFGKFFILFYVIIVTRHTGRRAFSYRSGICKRSFVYIVPSYRLTF